MSVRLILLSIFIVSTTLGCQQDTNKTDGSLINNLTNNNSANGAFHYSDNGSQMTDPYGFVALNGETVLNYKLDNQLVSLHSKDHISFKKSVPEKAAPMNSLAMSTFMETSEEGVQTLEHIYVTEVGQVLTTLSETPIMEEAFLKNVTGTKLFYQADFERWILVFSMPTEVLFYNSTDFKEWKHVGNFGKDAGYHGRTAWRSPDFFPIPVSGNTMKKKWVLLITTDDGHPSQLGGTQYFVGDFDGKLFVNNNMYSKVLWLDWGADNSGGLTALNTISNERIFVGRMNGSKYDGSNLAKEKSMLTIPRRLELRDTYYGLKLFATPVQAFEKSRGSKISQRASRLGDEENALTYSFSTPTEFVLNFTQKSNEGYTIQFSNDHGDLVDFSYSGVRKMYLLNRLKAGQGMFKKLTKLDGHYAPKFSTLPKINARIILDHNSIEIFVDDGLTCFSEFIFPSKPLDQMKIWGTTGQIMMEGMDVYQLE